jgi:hypothetical protein
VAKQEHHYAALGLMPDAEIKGMSGVLSLPVNLKLMLPGLEAARFINDAIAPKQLRFAESTFVCPLPVPNGFARYVLVAHLGRYFSKQVPRRACWNPLNRELLEAKSAETFAKAWANAVAGFIWSVRKKLKSALTVTVVPAKKGRPRRLERMLDQVHKSGPWPDDIRFEPDLLRFNDRAVSQHYGQLSRIE